MIIACLLIFIGWARLYKISGKTAREIDAVVLAKGFLPSIILIIGIIMLWGTLNLPASHDRIITLVEFVNMLIIFLAVVWFYGYWFCSIIFFLENKRQYNLNYYKEGKL